MMHVIYHRNCLDGLTAAAVCSLLATYTQSEITYTAMQYGEPFVPSVVAGQDVFIVDFSFPPDEMDAICAEAKFVVLLDHHKSAIEKFNNWHVPDNCTAVLDIGRSGAMLAWDYVRPLLASMTTVVRDRCDAFVANVDDRDRWVWRLVGTKEINAAGYDNIALHPKAFAEWICNTPQATKYDIGKVLVEQEEKLIERILKNAYVKTESDGDKNYSVVCVNSPVMQSELGNRLLTEYPNVDFACVWYETYDRNVGGLVRRLSFRSDDNHADVSLVANALGGGGHRNAAGASVTVEIWE